MNSATDWLRGAAHPLAVAEPDATAVQAARDGHHTTQIADVTRHRDRRVLDGYIRARRDPSTVARVL